MTILGLETSIDSKMANVPQTISIVKTAQNLDAFLPLAHFYLPNFSTSAFSTSARWDAVVLMLAIR